MPVIRSAALHEVEWGDGCVVVTPCNLYRCTIGNGVRIGPFCEIQENCIVGDDCVIGSHSFIAAGTIIGAGVFIGHGVRTCNDRHPRANNELWRSEPPIIGVGASIGSGAIILPGVMIGANAVIGAGMIVTKNVPDGTCVYNEQTRRMR